MTQASVADVEYAIDRDELLRLTLDLCDIESPAGQEAEVGAFVFDWMRREGFAPKKIGSQIAKDRTIFVIPYLPARNTKYVSSPTVPMIIANA